MSQLNQNSSREEIRAYIDNIIQRDKHQLTQKRQKNGQVDVQQLKEEMTSQIKQKSKSDNNELVEFDNLKTKVLKYIVYKKRTEKEVRQKFSSSLVNPNLLDDVIENLKENGYINDVVYIQRAMNEFLAINTLSLKEIRNKLYAKGLERDIIDTYFSDHEEKLDEYEITCAKKIATKKQNQMEQTDIENFLYRKGYKKESIRLAFED
ncbi:MAG: hypothetical protein HFJ32_01175 [Clostridia bacterium]|nr:hypothetical protein [Clostridia bacterium]